MQRDSRRQRRISARQAEVARLYEAGITTASAISKRVGTSRATAGRDLKFLEDRWIDQAAASFAVAKRETLARLERAMRELEESWELSKVPWQLAREALDTASDGERPAAVSRLAQISPGDPRYLSTWLQCIDKLIRILGLYRVHEVDRIQTIRFDFSQLSDEELEMLRTVHEAKAAAERADQPQPNVTEIQSAEFA